MLRQPSKVENMWELRAVDRDDTLPAGGREEVDGGEGREKIDTGGTGITREQKVRAVGWLGQFLLSHCLIIWCLG